MHEMLKKDQLEYLVAKLHIKRNILFKAFLINAGLILFFWLLSLTPVYIGIMNLFTNIAPMQSEIYLYALLGIWDVLGTVFFLVPALAKWWEMHSIKKMM